MSETINWSFSVGAVGGPRISGSDTFNVDAYDKISVVLAADDTDVKVEVPPANAAGKVHLLVIHASVYNPSIKYSIDGSDPTHDLNGPFLLIRSGAVGLLTSALQTLRFTNGTGAEVEVEILVARDSRS